MIKAVLIKGNITAFTNLMASNSSYIDFKTSE
jgi:hypothetical protein